MFLGSHASMLTTKLSCRQRLPRANSRIVLLKQIVLDRREKKRLVGRSMLPVGGRVESAQSRWERRRLMHESVREGMITKYHQGRGSHGQDGETEQRPSRP